MAVIGNSPTQQAFTAIVDYFNGNGSTTVFTLSRSVNNVQEVVVVIENVPQNPSTAYTISGNVITFTSAPPSGTNNIYVRYVSPIIQTIQPGQQTVGNAQMTAGAPYWDANGKVGIGTTNPTKKLDVAGSARFVQDAPASTGAIVLAQNSSDTVGAYLQWVNYANTAEKGFVTVDTSNNMIFATGSTERMRIDSNGYITTPYRPAFTRHISTAWSGTTYINFTSTSSAQFTANVGSHFNTSTGRFTAPVAGMYAFHCIATNNNTSTIRGLIQFRVNDINQGEYVEIGLAYQDVGTSGVFKLAAGDYVTIGDDGGTRASAGSFMGYFLG